MTLTRATLGRLTVRATKDITICGQDVRLQKPTPLEFSQYQMGLLNHEGKGDVAKFPQAIALLTARMWIDGDGNRLFKDSEVSELVSIDLEFYESLSAECQRYAQGKESAAAAGESVKTPVSDSPAESVSNSE